MLHGIGISPGVACAPALRYAPAKSTVSDRHIQDPEREQALFLEACSRVKRDLEENRRTAQERAGADIANIFDAHIQLLEDEDFVLAPILETIRRENLCAEAAAARQFDAIVQMIEALPDAYMRQRAADFTDLKEQLLRGLLHVSRPDLSGLKEDVILVADYLTPSDTVRMVLERIAGIVCARGSGASHAAILARSMGIPAVVCCPSAMEQINDGMLIRMDGSTGEIILE